MSAYDNDPRVKRVNDTHLRSTSSNAWRVRLDPIIGKWDACHDGNRANTDFYETADEAIHATIGDAQ
jgi:hypothetical protein